jgi:hypothetical protein
MYAPKEGHVERIFDGFELFVADWLAIARRGGLSCDDDGYLVVSFDHHPDWYMNVP